MKSITIKTYHIPSFLIEEIQTKQEINFLEDQLKLSTLKLMRLKEKSRKWEIMMMAIIEFKRLIHICFPKQAQTPVIKAKLKRLEEADFESIEELNEFIASTLFCIFFSEGADKVFDLNDPDFFDDEKCQKLFDQEIYISEKWLNQFILCLNNKEANENMTLHNLTPEWLWSKCFHLFLELYKLTQESIKNKN